MNHPSDNEQIWKQLNERAKELNCLYEIDKITSSFETTLNDVLNSIIQILPKGWRYPEICKIEIFCMGIYITSEDFIRTELKLSSSILIDSEKIGEINVYYIKPVRSEKGIFLSEELRLLNAVSDKISNFIRYKRLTEVISSNKGGLNDSKTNKPIDVELKNWLANFHLSDDQIKKLLSVPLHFKKGETIGKQGATTSYFMLLAEGQTKSYIENANRSYNFMISCPFDFIGLSSLFGNHYYFSTSALANSLVYLIDKQVFLQLLAQNSSFNFAIMKWYCNSYKIIFEKLNCISNKQAIGRMADTLLYLSQDVFASNLIPSTITRKDIAALASISTENAVRILSDFKSDKIINIVNNQIEIVNFDLLRTINLAG